MENAMFPVYAVYPPAVDARLTDAYEFQSEQMQIMFRECDEKCICFRPAVLMA